MLDKLNYDFGSDVAVYSVCVLDRSKNYYIKRLAYANDVGARAYDFPTGGAGLVIENGEAVFTEVEIRETAGTNEQVAGL